MPKTLLLNILEFSFLQNERCAHDPLPDILDVLDDGLEMRGGVVRSGDEDIVRFARGRGDVERSNRDEPERTKSATGATCIKNGKGPCLLVMDLAQQFQTGCELLLGPAGLDDSAHDGDEDVLGGDVVRA